MVRPVMCPTIVLLSHQIMIISIAAAGEEKTVAIIATIEQHTNKFLWMESIDIAHALSGRMVKKGGSLSSTRDQGYSENEAPNAATSKFTIADVIGIVNATHQSILSDDVLKALGETRNPEGNYASRVKFSKERMGKENAATMEGNITELHNLTEADLEAMYELPGKCKKLSARMLKQETRRDS